MPDEPGETRRRLNLVEQRLDAVESRVNSEAGLRAMMDLDQATLTARLDAQDHLLRALAVTQSEHGTQLRKLATDQARLADEQARLAGRVGQLDGKVERLDGKVDRLDGRVERVEAGIHTIISLLERDN